MHQTMGYPCRYADGSNPPIDCTVRHHSKSAFIGDDVEDFSPGLLSQLNRVIIDLREVPSPARNATLTFLDELGQPLSHLPVLKLDTMVSQNDNYVVWVVKK